MVASILRMAATCSARARVATMAALSVLLLLGACATPKYPPAPQQAAVADYSYRIGALDNVNIIVWRNPELSIAVPVRPDGSLGDATDVKTDAGKVGPTKATHAPPGSFAISGHDRTHAHMIQADPAGRFVLHVDLGLDTIFVWRFDATKGTLTAADAPAVSLPPGDGPRHFHFHPNGRWLYSVQEEGSTVVRFDYDAEKGTLTARQTISTLPRGYAGSNFCSEILVSADGRLDGEQADQPD